MRKLITLASVLFSTFSIASSIITLEDGRKVQLNDNFTWTYVNVQEEKVIESTVIPTKAVPLTAVPIKNLKVGTTIELGVTENTMQLSNSGADILLGKPSYNDGMLQIPTTITNQSSQSIISIILHIDVYDEQGKTISSNEQKIWSSVKRMADTYLRPKKIEQGKYIKLQVPKQQRYQIAAIVTEVETR